MSDLIEIPEAGETRRMGLLEQPPETLKLSWPVFASAGAPGVPALLDPSQWQETDLSIHCPPPEDQDGVGMCASSATETGLTVAMRMAGLDDPRLSGGDLYRRVSGGVDRGSLPEDNLREVIERGIATINTVPYLEWRRNPPGADEERRRFRGLEAWLCPQAGHVANAVMCGFPVVIGYWHHQSDPVQDGWMDRPSGRRGGHAVCVVGLTRRGNEWGFKFLNSWTPRWGVNGYGILPARRVEEGCRVFSAFALRATRQETGYLPPPRE